jgi:hypothetical protein
VREIVGAEGPLVMSNEIFMPGYDRRAIPGSPMRDTTHAHLVAAGFDSSVLLRADGWWR